ncbi:zinc finger protein 410 [Bombina bombina]|uniref:zinc finger protein 410 n=1 Tax=Bombina bombina TaxID=8345 RepID=UPI00235A59F9|nr:zinc finger protein 410 [Bombina bombina]
MLSDELESKPELLVEFVQNTSIPLGAELVSNETKDLPCLPLLPLSEASECDSLLLPDVPDVQAVQSKSPGPIMLNNLPVGIDTSSDATQGKTNELLSPSEASTLLQDIPPCDNSSFILFNLARAGLGSPAEHLVFVHDDAEDSGNDFLSSDCTDSSTPWFLRVQELAHDSLLAATRAQLAKTTKSASHVDGGLGTCTEAAARSPSEKRLPCSFQGCDRSFVWPTHLKYHLKTHRNERLFTCPTEGCGKSFYVLQRLKVHMRTHNGEKPFMCPESGCGKQFTTAGNLKNHLRIHTGEKPFLCETEGCGRSFAEYSSLRKHMVVHSGVKSHQCPECGKTFSQSGSRNAHVRKHHSRKAEDQPLSDPLLLEDSLSHSHLISMMAGKHSYEGDVPIMLH